MTGPLISTQVGYRPTFAEQSPTKRKDENEMRSLTLVPSVDGSATVPLTIVQSDE